MEENRVERRSGAGTTRHSEKIVSSGGGGALLAAPSPHLSLEGVTTRRMMADVLVALAPAFAASVLVFGWYAVKQVGTCVLSCLAAEYLFHTVFRKKAMSLGDLSAVVTGVILAMSLPWSAPCHVAVIASFAAIGFGKVIFGGLGMNIFNPAMVGRAFVMISFSLAMGAGAYVAGAGPEILTQATPLSAAKMQALSPALWPLFLGNVNGSLGETSALACLLGGIYLCWRKTASWEIPASMIFSALLFGGLGLLAGVHPEITLLHHLFGGALLFGAFFIATDPVTSPVTFRGKVLFGGGIGFFVVLIRLFSGYPEGVMFAVLLMNAFTPLLNRWTVPLPLGGPVPERK